MFPKFLDNLAQCLAHLTVPSTFYLIYPPDFHVCDPGIFGSPFAIIHPNLVCVYPGFHFSWSAIDSWLNAHHNCYLLQVRKEEYALKETCKRRSDEYRGCQEYSWSLQWLWEWINKKEQLYKCTYNWGNS
jgi:hypothetical protein